MMRLFVLGCVVSLGIVSAALAQTTPRTVPEDVRAAGESVAKYVRAMIAPASPVMFVDVNWKLNNPAATVRGWIAQDLAKVKDSASALATLKKPASKAKGLDLSFAVEGVRLKTEMRIASARRGLEAVEKMMDAQAAGDCAEYALQSDAFYAARQEYRAISTSREIGAIDDLLTNFAGVAQLPQVQMMPAPAPAPATNASRLAMMADDLAGTMRCPLPRAAFDIDVSFALLKSSAGRGPVFGDIHVTSDLEASRRAEIEARFMNFKLDDTGRFTNWTDAKQPFKFHWNGQVMTAVVE